jgi:hypothetical protein
LRPLCSGDRELRPDTRGHAPPLRADDDEDEDENDQGESRAAKLWYCVVRRVTCRSHRAWFGRRYIVLRTAPKHHNVAMLLPHVLFPHVQSLSYLSLPLIQLTARASTNAAWGLVEESEAPDAPVDFLPGVRGGDRGGPGGAVLRLPEVHAYPPAAPGVSVYSVRCF